MRLASVAHLPDPQSDRWRWARNLTGFGVLAPLMGLGFLPLRQYGLALAFWMVGVVLAILFGRGFVELGNIPFGDAMSWWILGMPGALAGVVIMTIYGFKLVSRLQDVADEGAAAYG